jgi:ribonuclease HI
LKGEVVSSSSCTLQHLDSATMAEAFALGHALQVIEEIGCTPVIVESDSLELVQAFTSVIDIWSP